MSSFGSAVNALLTNGRNDATEICRFDDLIFEGVGDPALARHITAKCARAIVEGRLTEGTVFGCVAGARTARKPGAYFVTSIKREFKASHLAWKTEEWDNR